MAGRIRDEDKVAVRERIDIVKVVSGYLQLKKAGRDSLVGICPFHTEKTASLSVSPGRQLFYCFGCGEGGDVFDFVRKIESLTFVEAVERLAREAGITLRYEGQTASSRTAENRKHVLHRALAEAAHLYNRVLMEGREGADARAYVAARGISPASVERFGVGFAPGAPDFLLQRLSKTYSPQLLVEAGLVAQDTSGAMRDRFRGRVMFPIHDLSGNAIGFGGRLLAGPNSPPNVAKYINSADSPIYHKSSLLYNLNRAKAEITRSSRAFLVEGYTDVIALDQAGIPTAVATCGTALGEDHARLLARFTDRIVLAFDSDEAGARAAERAFAFHQAHQLAISVLILPERQDPADFIQAAGPSAGEAFARLTERAVPLVEYMIRRSLKGRDLNDPEERAKAVQAGLAFVIPLEDPVRRDEYARILAGSVGEPENAVLLQLDRMLRQAPEVPSAPRERKGRISPEEEVEVEALKLLVQRPDLCAGQFAALGPDSFSKAGHRKAFELIAEAWGNPAGPAGASSLVSVAHERPGGEALGRLLAAVAVDPPKAAGEPNRGYAERVFLRLEEFSLKRRADAIRKELERVNPVKSPGDHETLFEQLVTLEGARRRARVAAEDGGSWS
jgi:DNA primase